MRIAIAVLILASMALAPVKAQTPNESNEQIFKELKVINDFADSHNLFETAGRVTVDSPWFVRLYRFPTTGDGDPISWQAEDYPTLPAAIQVAIHDYTAYPAGHLSTYQPAEPSK